MLNKELIEKLQTLDPDKEVIAQYQKVFIEEFEIVDTGEEEGGFDDPGDPDYNERVVIILKDM